MTTQVAAAARPTGKAAANRVPKKVETPLPPLNRRKTGKRWPRKADPAARATRVCRVASGAPRVSSTAASTARAPLPPSPSRVSRARSFRPDRRTLVAPMFPEPMLRGSPAPASLMLMTPKGVDPRR